MLQTSHFPFIFYPTVVVQNMEITTEMCHQVRSQKLNVSTLNMDFTLMISRKYIINMENSSRYTSLDVIFSNKHEGGTAIRASAAIQHYTVCPLPQRGSAKPMWKIPDF